MNHIHDYAKRFYHRPQITRSEHSHEKAAVVGGIFKRFYGSFNIDSNIFRKFSLNIFKIIKRKKLLKIIGIKIQGTIHTL